MTNVYTVNDHNFLIDDDNQRVYFESNGVYHLTPGKFNDFLDWLKDNNAVSRPIDIATLELDQSDSAANALLFKAVGQ